MSALPFAATLRSQTLDPIQQPAVGVRVVRPQLADEQGSGFVISVDNESVFILTARHLFYSGKLPFHDHFQVTFALDPLREYPAEWFIDFPNLDLAVIKVSLVQLPKPIAALLKDLPLTAVHPINEPLHLKEDIFAVGGSFQEWEVPKDSISSLQDGPRHLDGFRFTGIGVHGGFSGSAILDSANRLVGVHLGAVESDENYGRAQRTADALSILTTKHVPMNKLDMTRATSELDKHSIDPIVTVTGNLGGKPTNGAGIVFWRGKGAFYVATANHVVRRGDERAAGLKVRLSNARNQDLVADLEQSFSQELDLAVIKVRYPAAQGIDLCPLSLDRLAESDTSKKSDPVYPVGNPVDLPWWVPVSPGFVSEILENEITFAFPFIAKGYSGGGLIDGKGNLVGIITADDHSAYGDALQIHRMMNVLEGWGYLVDLNTHAGDGQIHDAIRSQRIVALQTAFASACPDLERTNRNEATPLAAASALGWAEGVELLLRARADVNGKRGSVFPLVEAIKNHHSKVADMLLEKNPDPNLGGALLHAITNHEPEIAKKLLDLGADPNIGDPVGAAIAAGDAATLRFLLGRYRAELKGGINLLYYPITHNDVAILTVLVVENGISLNGYIGDSTPLIIAARSSTPDVVEFLLRRGATLNDIARATDSFAFTALQSAIIRGSLPIVKLLVDAGSDLRGGSRITEPPLMLACHHLNDQALKRQEIFNFLLGSGRTSPQDRGHLLIRLLNEANYEIAMQVLTTEIDVNSPDLRGDTPAEALARQPKFQNDQKCHLLKLISDRGPTRADSILSPSRLVNELKATCRPR